MITTDVEAWEQFPHFRNFYNKLDVATYLGYCCGPSGIAPKVSGNYIVRPIYNLLGMGAGAKFQYIEAGDRDSVPPGYFWEEIFTGYTTSVGYDIDLEGRFKATSAYVGIRTTKDPLFKFNKWKRIDVAEAPTFPEKLFHFHNIFNKCYNMNVECPSHINIEFIDNRVIDVHIRMSPDPQYDNIIVVWDDSVKDSKSYIKLTEERGYKFIESIDNAGGHIPQTRKGFLVK